MMKRCRAGGEEEGGGGGGGGGGCGGGDSRETISFRSKQPLKAVCLQYQALSAEEGGVVDFHRGGLSGMDGERSACQTEQEMEGGWCQWCGDWLSEWGWQSWGSWCDWQLQQTWTGTEAEVASVEPNSQRGHRKKALLSVEKEGRVQEREARAAHCIWQEDCGKDREYRQGYHYQCIKYGVAKLVFCIAYSYSLPDLSYKFLSVAMRSPRC
ncbi:hypothetical protein D5F01_LYC06143 [Larimichthys crocea]|uniref:Uncharacterized protein n=1 Tax=Larimichthys crocea TaxID=215358 RepID=A0A6G0IV57_LARCR|nr:hypothetical protein D5F01_LYC06143 [Larimichthys crocea]